MLKYPNVEEIKATHKSLSQYVLETPLIDARELISQMPRPCRHLLIKPELFQRSGSFKFRGAINVARNLTSAQLQKGITAFSGGNHAIAVSYVAKLLGTTAKVVMPASANPVRVAKCKALGAEVFLEENRADVPKRAMEFVENEGRTLIPPFEHYKTVEATATLGLEFFTQAQGLDVVLMAIGGGGLAAGVACAIKQIAPNCKIIGVQARSADAMSRSLISGRAEQNINPNTVADSLCPPLVGEYTFAMCENFLDEVVIVEEAKIKEAMKILFIELKIVAEGAGAVPLAALLSNAVAFEPSAKVGFIIGGSSIDIDSFKVQAL